ncbi:MAG: HxlR family transcriptional regulator [Spirochaetes bacterium GWF1_51_8]|nr:MAG: HxlR family transcriptional regulator [Spirochaetes bacterium GWF1_51_8]
MAQIFACPVQVAVDTIGGKWKIVIIYHLLENVIRFGELKRMIPGITQKMLTQQLRELEADGIVARRVYAEVPPKVEYSITELGKKLEPVFTLLCGWGREYLKGKG